MARRRPEPKATGGVELVERIFDRVAVDPHTGCANWTGHRDRDGYGTVRVHLVGKMRVHRLVMLLCGGVLTKGLCVLHNCHNPSCCNPVHLRIGTDAENTADKVAAGRQLRGAAHGRAKLTDAAVCEIFQAPGLHREIAARFGVSRTAVSSIKQRRRWRHIHEAKGGPTD